jgi:hypothetical protein
MPRPITRCFLATGLGLALAACHPDRPRLNAPPQGDATAHPDWHAYYPYHNDNGMLADMAIADVHFIPHTAELSGTGQARLERYAELLATRGGTIAYNTTIADEKLKAARVATAKAFVNKAIPGTRAVEVVVGLPGGRGMGAKEASAAAAVAKQPEPRNTAYRLNQYTKGGTSK